MAEKQADAREQDEQAGQSDWGKMTEEQRQADIDAGFEQVSKDHRIDLERTGEYIPPRESGKEGDSETLDGSGDSDKAGEKTSKAAATDDGVSAGGEDDERDWLDSDTREHARGMGLRDEEIDSFLSADELDRALRILDRQAFDAEQASRSSAAGDGTGEGGKTAEGGDDSAESVFDPKKYHFGEEYEETARNAMNGFIDGVAKTINALAAEVKELRSGGEAVQIRNRAVESLQSLGYTELFGKPGETLSASQEANIDKVMESHLIHGRGLTDSGRKFDHTPLFLKAAAMLAFGSDIQKIDQRRTIDKLRKQESRRTGGGSSNRVEVPKTGGSRLEQLQSDPELESLFNELASQNG